MKALQQATSNSEIDTWAQMVVGPEDRLRARPARREKTMTISSEQRAEYAKKARKATATDGENVLREFKSAEHAATSRGAAHDLLEAVATLWQMLTDSSYSIPASTWGWIVLALGYFIMPLDAIPDPLPVLGYIDDAAVVAWVVSVIGDDIVAYKRSKQ